jgi:hypothetical protein
VLMKCPTCGLRISRAWLILGLPWSKYTCTRCGSVLAGTILRFVQNTIAVGVVGFFLMRVLKGRMSPLILLPMVVLALVLFLANLPGQIRRVRKASGSGSTHTS